jgi:hypothetical protein
VNGCDRCTLRIDKSAWATIASLASEVRAAITAPDAEWAKDASARLQAALEAVEPDQP